MSTTLQDCWVPPKMNSICYNVANNGVVIHILQNSVLLMSGSAVMCVQCEHTYIAIRVELLCVYILCKLSLFCFRFSLFLSLCFIGFKISISGRCLIIPKSENTGDLGRRHIWAANQIKYLHPKMSFYFLNYQLNLYYVVQIKWCTRAENTYPDDEMVWKMKTFDRMQLISMESCEWK